VALRRIADADPPQAARDGTPAETALAGWGARIRTWEWRNQNPQEAFDMQRLSGLMLHLCLMRQGVLAVPPPILAMIPSAPFVRR